MRGLSVREIKSLLLSFHSKRGYKIFESFPLVANDPTVMFTNATVTPFKSWFTDFNAKSCNFALIQRCFRAGGSSSMNEIGRNPNAHVFFEMFGTGTFGIDHIMAVKHLFELLDLMGIERERLYFTIPVGDDFRVGLETNGVSSRRIYSIEDNSVFWCKWQFGKYGPTGNGLTAIYSLRGEDNVPLDRLEAEDGSFIEFLNLIHIYGQEDRDGSIVPTINPGFEIGMGIERVATILQNCDGYQVDNVHPLIEAVAKYFSDNCFITDVVISRICAEYLRGICVLSGEGLLPSNKGAGYVFRKIIRRLLENIWLASGKPVFVEELIREFVCIMNSHDSSLRISESIVVDVLQKEYILFGEVLNRGIVIIQKNPNVSERILLDTYGLSPSLIQLIKKEDKHENR